jgi:hypothetical protein
MFLGIGQLKFVISKENMAKMVGNVILQSDVKSMYHS